MLIKYYLNDNINTPFEDFALGLRNVWAGPNSSNVIFAVMFNDTFLVETEDNDIPFGRNRR